MVEVELKAVRPVSQAAPEIIAYWKKRVGEVTWATPRSGWEQSMETAMDRDSGDILDAVLIRERIISITRKPWDRGRLVATPWFKRNESVNYSPAPGTLPPGSAAGTRLYLFLSGLDDDPRPSDVWPPIEQPVPYERARALPPEYQRFQ